MIDPASLNGSSIETLLKKLILLTEAGGSGGAAWPDITGNPSESDSLVSYVLGQIAAAMIGVVEIKGTTLNASTNPNYPAAVAGDLYFCSSTGKVGGVSGKNVTTFDGVLAIADNAGGTEAAVGTSWITVPTNLISKACPPLQFAFSDVTTAITAGTAKISIPVPFGMTVTGIEVFVATPQTSGSIFTVDINKNGTSILSTKATIDNGENSSSTAATALVISDNSLPVGSVISVDVDQVGDGTAKQGSVTILGVYA
jgi:hypothetical protein